MIKIHSTAITRSTVATIALIVAMTVASELSKVFKAFLADFTGHHWVTKGVFSIIFFILSYFVFKKLFKDSDDSKEILYVVASSIIGGLAIFMFYLWEFFR